MKRAVLRLGGRRIEGLRLLAEARRPARVAGAQAARIRIGLRGRRPAVCGVLGVEPVSEPLPAFPARLAAAPGCRRGRGRPGWGAAAGVGLARGPVLRVRRDKGSLNRTVRLGYYRRKVVMKNSKRRFLEMSCQ